MKKWSIWVSMNKFTFWPSKIYLKFLIGTERVELFSKKPLVQFQLKSYLFCRFVTFLVILSKKALFCCTNKNRKGKLTNRTWARFFWYGYSSFCMWKSRSTKNGWKGGEQKKERWENESIPKNKEKIKAMINLIKSPFSNLEKKPAKVVFRKSMTYLGTKQKLLLKPRIWITCSWCSEGTWGKPTEVLPGIKFPNLSSGLTA